MPPKGKRINASEVGQYAYCARSWWLSAVQKLEPMNGPALREGTAMHEQHAWQVLLARWFSRAAMALLGVGAFSFLVWGISRLLM